MLEPTVGDSPLQLRLEQEVLEASRHDARELQLLLVLACHEISGHTRAIAERGDVSNAASISDELLELFVVEIEILVVSEVHFAAGRGARKLVYLIHIILA